MSKSPSNPRLAVVRAMGHLLIIQWDMLALAKPTEVRAEDSLYFTTILPFPPTSALRLHLNYGLYKRTSATII